MFKKVFRRLTDKQKDIIVDVQQNEWRWITDHAKQRVFSTTCKKQVLVPGTHARIIPCSECCLVLANPRFKQAI
jgi:hypothetical protein